MSSNLKISNQKKTAHSPQTHCNTLQLTATHRNTLQRTATGTAPHCTALQHPYKTFLRSFVTAKTLQHTATHLIMMQHTATHLNTLPCNKQCN